MPFLCVIYNCNVRKNSPFIFLSNSVILHLSHMVSRKIYAILHLAVIFEERNMLFIFIRKEYAFLHLSPIFCRANYFFLHLINLSRVFNLNEYAVLFFSHNFSIMQFLIYLGLVNFLNAGIQYFVY